MPPPLAPSPTPRATGLAFGWVPALILLAPGILLLVPGHPIPEAAWRTALLFLWLGAALQLGRAAASPSAVVFASLGLLTATGLWLRPDRVLPSVGGSMVLVALPMTILAAARRPMDGESALATFRPLAWAGLAAAVWVLVDRLAGRPPVGPFGRAGVTGPTLAALLPLAFLIRNRTAGWALAAATAAGLVLTGSRTALAAALLGGLAFRAACVGGSAGRRLAWATTALGVAGVVVVTLSASGAMPGGSDGSWIGRSDTVKVRLGLGEASLKLLADAPPFTVHGADTFRSEILRFRRLEEAQISGGRRPLAAHDDYLHLAVEGGVFAGLALAALVVFAGAAAVRAARRAEGATRDVAAACLGVIVAIGVAALAEDPFLEAPTVLLFGIAAGTAACLASRAAAPTSGATSLTARLITSGVGAVLLLAAFAHGLYALSDARVASATGMDAYDIGARSWPRHEGRLFRYAASLASAGFLPVARDVYREVLDLDAGATEARLDIAETYRLEGRVDDARKVLEEAERLDGTRFDVPLRLGHLLLGPEDPPSRRAPPPDPVAIMCEYDYAIYRAPWRFEGPAALARLYRRLGKLSEAGAALREANRLDPGRAEILIESFRLAEVQGAPVLARLAILALALAEDPAKAGEIRDEASRCLDAGGVEEKAALDRAAAALLPPDFKAADADFDAATVRIGACIASDVTAMWAATYRQAAEADAKAGKHRRALAIYRGLLVDPYAKADPDIAFAAASSASRVDADLAAQLKARGRVLLGYEALEKKDVEAALKDFRAATDKDPANLAAQYGLARALARSGKIDDAVAALKRAIALDPSAAVHAATEPDLAAVWPLVKENH